MFSKEIYFSHLKTRFFGRVFSWCEDVSSTNDYLLDNITEPGEAVAALRQSKGRGRSGRSWFTTESGLAFSISLPVDNPQLLMPIHILAGYSVAKALRPYAPIKVKWPNDCVADGQKICGMLIDTRFRGSICEKAVLGIGINLAIEKFPAGSVKKASSVGNYYNGELRREEIMASVLNNLEDFIDCFKSGHFDMVGEWENYSANIGHEITVHRGGTSACLIEKGIDISGSLIATDENGKEEVITSGEIGYDFGH